MKFWDSELFWRRSTAVFAVLSLALLVAAIIAREPPNFSSMPVVAVIRDSEQRPVWAVRLARKAHQIAADSLHTQAVPAGQVYQLWLSAPDGGVLRQLGLLPQSGRKRIAVSPRDARLLMGTGELVVTARAARAARRARRRAARRFFAEPSKVRVEHPDVIRPGVDCGAGSEHSPSPELGEMNRAAKP